ncbi:MAG: DUF3570 domain-containing protein [Myxococcota bacterium]
MQLKSHIFGSRAATPAFGQRTTTAPVVRSIRDAGTRAARVGLLGLALALSIASTAHAETGVGTTTTVFHESGGPLNMTVITPSAQASVDIGDPVTVSINYEADIVTGASVAVVDAPGASVDAVTSATTLDDVRQNVGGSFQLRGDTTSIGASYNYGFESDYRTHSFSLNARAEVFERNTAFEISYARGFDQVCNLPGISAQEAVERSRMPDAEGCFEDDGTRDSLDLDLHTFQGSWTQAWSPVFSTQFTLTAQVLNGFQGNPYRGVWLGRTAAQENHPELRIRYAAGLRARLWIKPLNGAVQVFGRVYRDTWDIESLTAELAYDQVLADALRLRVRGRYYTQSGAAFYSDDYTRFPRGQYFTGDRELSQMNSFAVGGRLSFSVPADDEGYVLGFMDSFDIIGKFDYLITSFPDFRYAQAEVPNTNAIVGTLGLEAGF